MRISIEDGDPGQISTEEMSKYDVFFNGQKMDSVLTADDDMGLLHHQPASQYGGSFEKKLQFGTVEIKRKSPTEISTAKVTSTPPKNPWTATGSLWTNSKNVKC